MARRKVSRNAPCPCGSGRKYKHCCHGKGFEWQEDEEGGVYKSVPLSDEMADILEQQRQKLIGAGGFPRSPSGSRFRSTVAVSSRLAARCRTFELVLPPNEGDPPLAMAFLD